MILAKAMEQVAGQSIREAFVQLSVADGSERGKLVKKINALRGAYRACTRGGSSVFIPLSALSSDKLGK